MSLIGVCNLSRLQKNQPSEKQHKQHQQQQIIMDEYSHYNEKNMAIEFFLTLCCWNLLPISFSLPFLFSICFAQFKSESNRIEPEYIPSYSFNQSNFLHSTPSYWCVSLGFLIILLLVVLSSSSSDRVEIQRQYFI